MPRRQIALAFALGAVTGVAGTMLWTRRGVDDRVLVTPDSESPAAAPSLRESGAGEPLAAAGARRASDPNAVPVDSPPRESATSPTALDDAPDVVLPVIEVTVIGAAGIPSDWRGTAYALPAGTPGVDAAGGASTVAVGLVAPAMLKVPALGTYDVGVAWPGAFILVPDVLVAASGPARATLRLPASAPVRVEVKSSGAGREENASTKASAGVTLAPQGDGVAHTYPGRSEHARTPVRVRVDSLSGSASSSPLPVAASFQVTADLWLTAEMKVGDSASGSITSTSGADHLVPAPGVVQGGGEVRLSRESLAIWRIRFATEPSPWPASSLDATLRWTIARGWNQPNEADLSDVVRWVDRPFETRAGAGPAKLSWSGPGIVPGGVTATLRAGETTESIATIRRDDAVPEVRGLVLDTSGAPGDAGTPLAIGWGPAFASQEADDESSSDLLPSNFVPRSRTVKDAWASRTAPRSLLAPVWRDAAGIMLLAGNYVSRLEQPPKTGDWKPVVELGGTILVVPDPIPDASLGSLVIRRADGAPLILVGSLPNAAMAAPAPAGVSCGAGVCGAGSCGARGEDAPPASALPSSPALAVPPAFPGPGEAREEVTVEAGTRIGPLAPGEVTLEPRLGSLRLPPATLRVRPGRITTWTIRWTNRGTR